MGHIPRVIYANIHVGSRSVDKCMDILIPSHFLTTPPPTSRLSPTHRNNKLDSMRAPNALTKANADAIDLEEAPPAMRAVDSPSLR